MSSKVSSKRKPASALPPSRPAKRKRPPRLKPRIVTGMLERAAAGLDRSFGLADAAYMQGDALSPLIMQAVFRELMIELRTSRDQVNLILERNGGNQ